MAVMTDIPTSWHISHLSSSVDAEGLTVAPVASTLRLITQRRSPGRRYALTVICYSWYLSLFSIEICVYPEERRYEITYLLRFRLAR